MSFTSLQLGQYCESFEAERVDGAVLMLLGKAELVELGVVSALHSARILGMLQFFGFRHFSLRVTALSRSGSWQC